MSRPVLNLMVAGLLLWASASLGESLPAKLVMGNGKVWKGVIIERDGDWIVFQKDNTARPVRVGASTIKELDFRVSIDANKVSRMVREQQLDKAIEAIDKAIAPFSEYRDLPTNLTRYSGLLMELLFRSGKYSQSLELSAELAKDSRNPKLQQQARVYQALALLNLGRMSDAEALFAEYGWDLNPTDDSSAEMLYIAAKYMELKKQFTPAIENAARVVAFHSQDPDWIQPAELLCAQLYTDLGLYDSADEVCREILLFYRNTPEADAATSLKIKIEKLRAEQKLKDSLKTDEA